MSRFRNAAVTVNGDPKPFTLLFHLLNTAVTVTAKRLKTKPLQNKFRYHAKPLYSSHCNRKPYLLTDPRQANSYNGITA